MAFSIKIGRNTCSISHSSRSLRVGRARATHPVRSEQSPPNNTWESWTNGILGNGSISGGSQSPVDTSKSRHNGLPNYGIPNPGSCAGYRKSKKNKPSPTGNSDMMQGRKKAWWSYQIPAASSFSGYIDRVRSKIDSLSLQPQYGFTGGPPGGRGGWGGGGGGSGGSGGSDGDPMKGFTYLFAFAIFGSGLGAYIRKGSTTSLLVSTGVAVLLLISASLMGHPTYKIGTLLSLATCIALAAIMGLKAKSSGKIFPAGVVAIMSGLMSVGYFVTLM